MLSLVVTIGLLVLWVIYVLLSASTITELAQRAGSTSDTPYWSVLWSGVVLFMLVIGGLTFQLALALGARRYSSRQEEFVSNITHEMKSPLAAIKLHAQTLQQGDVTDGERQRSVKFILQQVDRMGSLVDNVLESSRLMNRVAPRTWNPWSSRHSCNRSSPRCAATSKAAASACRPTSRPWRS